MAGIYNNNYAQQTAQYNAMIGGLAGIGGMSRRPRVRHLLRADLFRPAHEAEYPQARQLGQGRQFVRVRVQAELIADGGLRHIGVMADEVEAHTRRRGRDRQQGSMRSNYDRVAEELGA